SETPVTDGRRVYVYHASAGLFAVDFAGRIVWSHQLHLPTANANVQTVRHEAVKRTNDSYTLPPAELMDIGSAASPVLHNGRLYVTMDYEPRVWMMAAIDAETGKEVWRVQRPKQHESFGWSTPYVWKNAVRTEIITAGDLGVRSYDVDGNLLWVFTRLSVN